MAASPEAQALLEQWRTETDFSKRDELLAQLVAADIFPQIDQDQWEVTGGLYPGLEDPNFLPKLMRKREYQESKQPSVKESLAEGKDRCRTVEDFQLSPTQRFVSRLLNPRTPFRSALLFHGVGVGKTCAAVTICESYLEAFPGRKAFVVAPKNIQSGFKRTLFDIEGLRLKTKPGEKNHHRGCTGDIYLKLTNSFEETDKDLIQNRVTREINKRYQFFGYGSFYNFIQSKISKLKEEYGDGDRFEDAKRELIRREFGGRVLIIDEAHNLRDNPLEASAEAVDDASVQDTDDSKAGKRLTPFLRQVLRIAEDVTLVLMTATPMYNRYDEIIFLMNLLLVNDKRPELLVEDVFDTTTETFREGGKELLGRFASNYISYMRGENPLTFPLRLEPEGEERMETWPKLNPKKQFIPNPEREASIRLPCLKAIYEEEVEAEYKDLTNRAVNSREGLGITNMNMLVQAGNWIYPADEGEPIENRVGVTGFENTFNKEQSGSLIRYRCADEERGASWLLHEELPSYSAKTSLLLDRLNECKGVAFVYSRFVQAGALSIALALEANGYTPYGREPLLLDGNQRREGRQCAFCSLGEKGHGRQPAAGGLPAHDFKPARYVLLTGSPELSPNNAAMITAARSPKNIYGEDIKVILGSQIAGEGLDLKYIREVFVFDSWYHLNKLEQVIGRGIRNCSHAALEEPMRNCTISLLVNAYGTSPQQETVDQYSYRYGMNKAKVTGAVSRVLKEYALDCSLNREAILVKGLEPLPYVLDSLGERREDVDRNDTPFTSICDWLDTCEYECHKGDGQVFQIDPEDIDTSTYDEYTAHHQMSKIRNYLQELISEGTAFVSFENIAKAEAFKDIPKALLASLLSEMVLDRNFKVKTAEGEGRILYKHGYYLYQPDAIQDTSIPISIRLADVPIPRDRYPPRQIEIQKLEEEEETAGEEDSEELWEEVKDWAETMRNGTAKKDKVPAVLLDKVAELRQSVGIAKQQAERLGMILWIYRSVYDSAEMRGKLADIVLEYVWDEFLTSGTRREQLLLNYTKPWMQAVARDSYWQYEGSLYLRILNGDTNTVEYFCPSAPGKIPPCPKGVVEILATESARSGTKDPLLQKPLNEKTTGYKYGFMVYNEKKQRLVFKKGEPPAPGKKIGRGAECSISSSTTYERNLLKGFGDLLRGLGVNTIGLEEGALASVENSVRICTLGDLALRYMDKERIQGKRWFYRPLEAKLYKHPLK